jgi:hypothetical protein
VNEALRPIYRHLTVRERENCFEDAVFGMDSHQGSIVLEILKDLQVAGMTFEEACCLLLEWSLLREY